MQPGVVVPMQPGIPTGMTPSPTMQPGVVVPMRPAVGPGMGVATGVAPGTAVGGVAPPVMTPPTSGMMPSATTAGSGVQRNVPVVIYRRPPDVPTAPLPVPAAR
jgi:hypothetical protein